MRTDTAHEFHFAALFVCQQVDRTHCCANAVPVGNKKVYQEFTHTLTLMKDQW